MFKKLLTKVLVSPWTALATLAVIITVSLQQPTFLESVKLRYFDTLITSQPIQELNIATVNIDEAALDTYGQWPFSRNVYADIIKDLYARGAGLVVWNIMMPEIDRLGGDDKLVATLKEYPTILPNTGSTHNKNQARFNPNVVIGDPSGKVVEYPGIISNIKQLEESAYGVGIVNTFPEVDGVVRRAPMVILSNSKLYPSMAFEVLRVLAGDTNFQIKFNELGIDKMRIPKFGPVTTDQVGRVWVDWQQRPKTYSLMKLPQDFGSSVVIVGPSASGIANPIATSRGEVWPQEMQAAVIGTLANGVNIKRPDWAPGAELLSLIVISLILLTLSRWVYVGLGTSIVVLGAIVPVTGYLYANYLMLFDAPLILGGSVLIVLHAYGIKFVNEFLQKQQIKKQFGTYLSPDLVAKLQRNPDLLRLGGTKQPLSIMFTDVRGFTAISEHYGEDVQGLTSIMNRYMTAMTESILLNNGTLDKYIGDAQMAFWNAPLDNERHADDAITTALEMLDRLEEFNQEVVKEGIPAFGMGVGINTGVVVVGNMGSKQRFDYTCLGDAVNLASRLEGQSKSYGLQLIVGESTVTACQQEHGFIELDRIAVKGKIKPETIYTIGNTNWDLHKEFLENYYAGNWEHALTISKKLEYDDDVIFEYYRAMCIRLTEGCPEEWKGYYVATSK